MARPSTKKRRIDMAEDSKGRPDPHELVTGVFMPMYPDERYLDIGVNGNFYRLPANEQISVPRYIAEVANQAREQRFKVSENLPAMQGGGRAKKQA
jgi:hypothetical protein